MLELGEAAAGSVRGQALLDDRPLRGVVDVTERIDVDAAELPRPAVRIRRRIRELEPRRHASPGGGCRRRPTTKSSPRPVGRPDVGSTRIQRLTASIDAPRSPVIDVRRSAQLRPVPAQNVDNSSCSSSPAGPADLDHRAAHHPAERIVEFGVGGVVGGDVLQVPGDRVEAEPGPGVDIAEADRARPGDDAPDRRTLDEHAGGEVGHVRLAKVLGPATHRSDGRS